MLDFHHGLLGAIAGVLNLGLNWYGGRETLFLIQEADTLAMQFPNPERADHLSFGWQIRPIGGQKTVRPGLHQLFVLISLPGELSGYGGGIQLETRWRRWNARDQTIHRASICKSIEYRPIVDLEPGLKDFLEGPRLDSVRSEYLGDGQILVKLDGDNFTNKTRIKFADNQVAKSTGLKVLNEFHMEFVAKQADLARAQFIWIQAEAGEPVRVADSGGNSSFRSRDAKVSVFESSNDLDTYSFRVDWESKAQSQPSFDRLFVLAGDLAFNVNDEKSRLIVEQKFKNCKSPEVDSKEPNQCVYGLKFSFDLPMSMRSKVSKVVLRDLFASGLNSSLTIPIGRGELLALDKATIVARNKDDATLAVFGNGFGKSLRLLLGGEELPYAAAKHKSQTFLLFETKNSFAVAGNRLLGYRVGKDSETILDPILTVQIDPAPTVAEPVFETPVKIELGQGDNSDLVITGKNFDSIARITFNNATVLFKQEEKGTKLTLKLDSLAEITKESATARQFRIVLKNDKELTLAFSVKPAPKA